MGGWSYEPWRETFYPKNVPKAGELAYASQHVSAIEVNGTFYRLQTPAVFARWRDETPDEFLFSLKAARFIVNRRVLAEAGESMHKFFASGLTELGPKLGPILWQLAETKAFDAKDLEAFLALLPKALNGRPLRHALEVRHDSFKSAQFVELARRYGVTAVFADTDEYPSFADITGDFVYARLMRTAATQPTGYTKPALKKWVTRARTWATGEEPEDLPRIVQAGAKRQPRDVFLYFISGAKERNPAAATHVMSLLREQEEIQS